MPSYYRILGVAPTASAAEIRSAYRKLAKLYHPDANPGDPKAEDLFKKVAVAYQILANPDTRRVYDLSRPPTREPNDVDSAAPPETVGKSIKMKLYLTLEEVARGGSKKVKYTRDTVCISCDGKGLGTADGKYCRFCEGKGAITAERSERVEFPIGVRPGETIRKRGLGHVSGVGVGGDLMVTIHYKTHKYLTVSNDDLHYRCYIGLDQYIEGGRLLIPTANGTFDYAMSPHFPDGGTLRLAGKGLPAHGDRSAGALIVTVKVCLPRKLSSKERTKVQELTRLPGFCPSPDRNGFFPFEED